MDSKSGLCGFPNIEDFPQLAINLSQSATTYNCKGFCDENDDNDNDGDDDDDDHNDHDNDNHIDFLSCISVWKLTQHWLEMTMATVR